MKLEKEIGQFNKVSKERGNEIENLKREYGEMLIWQNISMEEVQVDIKNQLNTWMDEMKKRQGRLRANS